MYTATSLHAEGAVDETAASVLQRFCPAFLGWYRKWQSEGFAPVRDAWLCHAEKLHQAVEVRLDVETIGGTFVGLAADGAMLLQQGNRCRTIVAGDVFPAAV